MSVLTTSRNVNLNRPHERHTATSACLVLTGPIEASGDGVQEGVLWRNQTPHHRHSGASRAASLPPLRAVALDGSGHEARQELGRNPRRSSQPLKEGAEPRDAGLQGPVADSDHRRGDPG